MQFCDAGVTQSVKRAHVIVTHLPHPVRTQNPSPRTPRRRPGCSPRTPGWFCSQVEPRFLHVPTSVVTRTLAPEAEVQPLRAVALCRETHRRCIRDTPSLPASGPLTGAAAVSSRAVLLGPHPGLGCGPRGGGPQPQRSTTPAARVSVRALSPGRVRAQAPRLLCEPRVTVSVPRLISASRGLMKGAPTHRFTGFQMNVCDAPPAAVLLSTLHGAAWLPRHLLRPPGRQSCLGWTPWQTSSPLLGLPPSSWV